MYHYTQIIIYTIKYVDKLKLLVSKVLISNIRLSKFQLSSKIIIIYVHTCIHTYIQTYTQIYIYTHI